MKIWELSKVDYLGYNEEKRTVFGYFKEKPSFETVKKEIEECDAVVGALLRNDHETISKYIKNTDYYLGTITVH